MRGCSLRLPHRVQLGHVVPAHAGMFPTARRAIRTARDDPRMRGDVPIEITKQSSNAA